MRILRGGSVINDGAASHYFIYGVNGGPVLSNLLHYLLEVYRGALDSDLSVLDVQVHLVDGDIRCFHARQVAELNGELDYVRLVRLQGVEN